eukprot:TRINITY_DN37597_c0_g1_i1.p2 TRINITY_DN37597_c0_g1~~TRINITY_DN37597_c0_g1_i1.p2  ORF type:complete len:116 (-),score=1.58 TRINITY_DN37597_c0_g1_i1:270-617(-)
MYERTKYMRSSSVKGFAAIVYVPLDCPEDVALPFEGPQRKKKTTLSILRSVMKYKNVARFNQVLYIMTTVIWRLQETGSRNLGSVLGQRAKQRGGWLGYGALKNPSCASLDSSAT